MSNSSPHGPRTYIVTGGAGGIGGALVQRLLQTSANVMAADISQRRLDILATDTAEIGGKFQSLVVDITSESGARSLVAETLSRFGELHGIANVAGGIRGITESAFDIPLAEISISTLRDTASLNVESALLLSQAAEPHFGSVGYGKIANVTSLAAYSNHLGMGNIAYNVAKAGVIALTRSLALLLGPKGIRVNAVAPGMVLSDRLLSSVSNDEIEQHRALTSLNSFATPIDVANALAFFLEPESDQITGEILRVAAGVR